MKKYFVQFICWLLFCSSSLFSQVQVESGTSPDLPPPAPGSPPPVSVPSPPPPPPSSLTPDALSTSSLSENNDDSIGSPEVPAFSPLSDPEELLLIDGLDDEFQVLKLRDQDTNMILDVIQLITGRYILRPQNLPAVKITFDSMAVLTKGKHCWLWKVCWQ